MYKSYLQYVVKESQPKRKKSLEMEKKGGASQIVVEASVPFHGSRHLHSGHVLLDYCFTLRSWLWSEKFFCA